MFPRGLIPSSPSSQSLVNGGWKTAGDSAWEGRIDAELAVVDQLLCANAAVFVGARESTYTSRIREERFV
jgi:hypothetical protein